MPADPLVVFCLVNVAVAAFFAWSAVVRYRREAARTRAMHHAILGGHDA